MSASDLTALPVPFESRKIGFVLAFFAVCYLAFLGSYPLIDPDEPVYAETGKQMALAHGFGAWWTPHYNGAMWFDKPPVTYWLVGLSMKLFGVSEFAARLPMALAALALIWVTALLAHRIYPQSQFGPVWAALVIGSCAQSLILAHACVTDMLFVLSLSAALLGVWDWLTSARLASILWSGVVVGLSVMIKGPVAIVLVGALILLYLAIERQLVRLCAWPVWLSLLIALAVSLPWYLSMVEIHGQVFVRSFLEAQNVTRYLTAEHSATASPLFFIPVLLAGLLPWTFAFVPAAATALARFRTGATGDRFALIWIGLVFLFFSASQSKLVTYIYPLYPLAAVVTGFWIAEYMTDRAAVWLSVAASILPALAIGYAEPIVWGPAGSHAGQWLIRGTAVLLGFAPMTVRLNPSRMPLSQPWRAFAVCYPGILLTAFIPIAATGPMWKHPDPKSISAIEIARAVAANSTRGDVVYALTFNKPSLVYYSGRDIQFTDNQDLVGRALSKPPFPICVTKPDIISSLEQKHYLSPYRILAQTGSKVVLITCEPPIRGG